MSANGNGGGASRAHLGDVGRGDAAVEEELSEALLEDAPEGRGPGRRVFRREVVLVAVCVGIALLITAGLIIAARPPYTVVVTVAVIGIMYAAASPVLIAMLLRRRDEVVAHRRAHEIAEDISHGGGHTGVSG